VCFVDGVYVVVVRVRTYNTGVTARLLLTYNIVSVKTNDRASGQELRCPASCVCCARCEREHEREVEHTNNTSVRRRLVTHTDVRVN